MEKNAISRLAELFVLLDRERYNPTFVNNTTEFTDEELKEVRNFFINNLKENAAEIVDYLITSCNGPVARKYVIENKLNLIINSLLTSYQQMSMATQGAQPYGLAPNQQMFMQANQGAQACPPMPNSSALVAACNDLKNDVRYGIDDPYNKLTKSKDELRKALCNIQGRVTIARYYVPDYIKESDNIVCLVESNDFQERNKQQEFMCTVNDLVEGTKDYSKGYNCDTVLDFRSHMSPDDNEKLRDVITNCVKAVYSLLSELKVTGVLPYCINSTKETFEKKLKEALEELFSYYNIDWYEPIRRQAMTWDHVKAISQHPLCTIGGHTVSHTVLNQLNEEEFRQEVFKGIEKLQAAIGKPIHHFAYPYGSPNEIGEREFQLISEFGFKTVFSSYGGCITNENKNSITHLPRVYLHE